MVFFLNRFKKIVVKKIIFKKSFMAIANKALQNCVKQGSVYFLLCPKQGPKIEGGVPHRVCV